MSSLIAGLVDNRIFKEGDSSSGSILYKTGKVNATPMSTGVRV